MLVQGVEQAVTETPEEEEDGDEDDGEERLTKGQFGSLCAARVIGLEGAPLEEASSHDCWWFTLKAAEVEDSRANAPKRDGRGEERRWKKTDECE